MPTPNIIFRAPDHLRELAKARAKRDRCNVSDVARAALHEYLTGDNAAEAQVKRLEGQVKRLEEKLAAAKAGVPVRDVRRPPAYRPGRDARVAARDAKDERFAAALDAATPENPVTVDRLAAVSGFTKDWCRHLLRALGDAGYAQKVTPAQWAAVPGRDIREGIRAGKGAAVRASARIGPRYREGGDLARPAAPGPVPFRTAP